jgi:hypothetical protein
MGICSPDMQLIGDPVTANQQGKRIILSGHLLVRLDRLNMLDSRERPIKSLAWQKRETG